MADRIELLGLNLAELTELIGAAGFPAFRAKQLHHWMYRRAALSFDEMHNLAREFRAWLTDACSLGHATIRTVRESADGTRKIAFALRDGELVESVLMPERDWWTLCVSSQVGCPLACAFCMTGMGGFRRDMTAGEILSQVLVTKRLVHGDRLPRNLVFMGMGEPLLNLDNVCRALRLLVDPEAVAIASRRTTISTAGLTPMIEQLGRAHLGVNLAISLNAVDDALRSRIMPINRKYPIAGVLDACRAFPLRERRRITFEYVLLGGLNDSRRDAEQLAALLHGFPCKLNLIPWNAGGGLPFHSPTEEAVRKFQQLLLDRNFTVSVRYSKGADIAGACGQLAAHMRHATEGRP